MAKICRATYEGQVVGDEIKLSRITWVLEGCGKDSKLLGNWSLSRETPIPCTFWNSHSGRRDGWEGCRAVLADSLGDFCSRVRKLTRSRF